MNTKAGAESHVREGDEIKCRPPRPPLWHYPALIIMPVFVPGLFILAGMVMVSECVTNYSTTDNAKIVMAVASAFIAIALMAVFLRWEQDRWYWVLSGDRLIGGILRDKTFHLASVDRVVLGMPVEGNLLMGLIAAARPDLADALRSEKKIAIVLMFKDGSILPMHLYRCENGSRLMARLLEQVQDRVVPNYRYSATEERLLRQLEWNRPVRAGR